MYPGKESATDQIRLLFCLTGSKKTKEEEKKNTNRSTVKECAACMHVSVSIHAYVCMHACLFKLRKGVWCLLIKL